MSDSILRTKSKDLAKKIIYLCKDLQTAHTPSPLVNQLMRSGTSIGANIHEAQYAQGKVIL
jgi:four helix bundle protein